MFFFYYTVLKIRYLKIKNPVKDSALFEDRLEWWEGRKNELEDTMDMSDDDSYEKKEWIEHADSMISDLQYKISKNKDSPSNDSSSSQNIIKTPQLIKFKW